jgi:hypothetical protein
MMRLLRIIFSPASERHDDVTRRVNEASEQQERASNQLLATIGEMLSENDRLTGRLAHARKPRT